MDKSLQKGAEMPKSVGAAADEYKRVRDIRLAMKKETKAVEARERELRKFIIDNLSKSDDTGAAGKKFRAQIKTVTIPSADDWEKIRGYIVENDRFDLLQKRLSDKAVKEIWEDGDNIPGVGKFNKTDVSITKI